MLSLMALAILPASAVIEGPDLVQQPYLLDSGLESRSISFENPTGAPGEGGKAVSELGPGTVRHIWITTDREPVVQRACVIRGWWEGQSHPSIECPIGDLFGFAHGKITSYQSAVHSCGPTGGRNLWLPMPFAKRARFTFTNEGDKPV